MPDNDNDLHMMVGEIRSDVKKLLKLDARVSTLEKKWWTTLAAIGLLVPVAVARAFGWH